METEEFDSTLWQQLPFELLENVLARLPSLYPSETPPYLAVPSTKTNTWEKHTLNFTSSRVYVAATDEGLICFGCEPVGTLFIYNPLSRQWRKLTIPEQDNGEGSGTETLVGLIVDRATNYKLIVGFLSHLIVIEKPTRTLIYDSVSSTWTTVSVCPVAPSDYVDWSPGFPDILRASQCVRCGHNVYWLVEECREFTGVALRFLVKFDVKAGIWTVDEPDLPYPHYVGFTEDDMYLRPDSDLPKPYGLGECDPPPWNFHLASNGGAVYVTLFDSLLCKDAQEAYSGEFSDLIPEVRIIDADFVCEVWELANPPEGYLPTKAVSLVEVWFVVFEYGGICRTERGNRPLLVFTYNARRNVWGWLPELGSNSSCLGVVPEDYPAHWLPEFFTCTLSLRAFL
ncbi:hypothetical protein R1sor_009568 [Riccia sorocarpa]|uniref:Uncharacterized protein n=1 Tax=Riccia sorocarpa TaxID=122646 RepID=A0ABD3HVH2_9MARC